MMFEIIYLTYTKIKIQQIKSILLSTTYYLRVCASVFCVVKWWTDKDKTAESKTKMAESKLAAKTVKRLSC